MDEWLAVLEIIKKYCNSKHKYRWPLWSTDGIIGFNIDVTKVTKEDMESLEELGVFYDERYDSLIRFV